MMATSAAGHGYREVSESEWRTVPESYSHGSHSMVYAQWPGKFLGKYEYKYAVSVSEGLLPYVSCNHHHGVCVCTDAAAF